MIAMVADVLSPLSDSNHDMDMSVNQTHTMAPQERPPRSQIILETQKFSRFR